MTQPSFPFYTPLAKAVTLLHSRQAAYALASESMLENHLAARPYAVYSPHVATPNFGMERFVTLATSVGLTPLILEFNQDKFVTCNPEKHALARMVFHAGTGRNGGPRNRVLTLTDLHAADGTAICQTTTHWGQRLVPFHHELLRSRLLLNDTEIVDGSPFFLAYSGGARHYYPDFFSLFVRHAILFESFLFTTPSDQKFTTEIAIPAFHATTAKHGCHPLICRLDPPESEGQPYWYQYPDELHGYVSSRLQNAKTQSRSA